MPTNIFKLMAFVVVGCSFLIHALYLIPLSVRQMLRKKSPATPLRIALFHLFVIDAAMFFLYADSLYSHISTAPMSPLVTLIIPMVLLIHTMVFVFFSQYKFPLED